MVGQGGVHGARLKNLHPIKKLNVGERPFDVTSTGSVRARSAPVRAPGTATRTKDELLVDVADSAKMGRVEAFQVRPAFPA